MSHECPMPAYQQARERVRKGKVSAFNRLHSIHEDAAFVSEFRALYPHLPIVGNQRCGTWYVDPATALNEPAYFKSTDGHYGRWDFNMRRANLNLIPIVEKSGGIIIVDSTRRGKRFPDALSKTIPTWCCVINRASKAKRDLTDWDDKLYTPPIAVSPSEHAQIENGLEAWTHNLLSSSFDVIQLTKPLRPIWISPASTLDRLDISDLDFYPVFCVSASKLVENDGIERRLGYVYVQGSGDDHEMWSKGLTPRMYWENVSRLIATPEHHLDDLVKEIAEGWPRRLDGLLGCTRSLSPIKAAGGRIMLGACDSALGAKNWPEACDCLIQILPGVPRIDYDRSQITQPTKPVLPELEKRLDLLSFSIPPAKRAQKYFISNFARVHLLDEAKLRMLGVVCWEGKDLSAGVAVAILQSFFDEDGNLEADQCLKTASKASLRRRLEWVQASHPEANPSRSTLKRINEFFMSTSPH
ncbi:tRNA A64-2'-O-ribosylphosphate transferase [Cantharellus anzutake]|uniref:tRNA A64-2'-O-ribosylphosphate transferase n=1 Tax=Cantharellus anzutake TaxID=1750568 RepID=UPI001905B9D9|nr:tRNA A64-2'-O-ribosylphosphate transferase [Cantharellus anzutake]KAF8340475.1 tRNA A64-2'-O-ribosylphosphate transferase [Cantharellus anzutake]